MRTWFYKKLCSAIFLFDRITQQQVLKLMLFSFVKKVLYQKYGAQLHLYRCRQKSCYLFLLHKQPKFTTYKKNTIAILDNKYHPTQYVKCTKYLFLCYSQSSIMLMFIKQNKGMSQEFCPRLYVLCYYWSKNLCIKGILGR